VKGFERRKQARQGRKTTRRRPNSILQLFDFCVEVEVVFCFGTTSSGGSSLVANFYAEKLIARTGGALLCCW